MEQFNQIEFFNLNNDGDSAIVRILHTKVETIESAMIHRLEVGGKFKNVKCVGDNCPICMKDNPASKKIYVHLFDYTDDKEKVWCRTDKILSQLEEIEKNWGNISECVVRITRKGAQFPKYSVDILNAKNYAPVDESLIDTKIAYRFHLTRSADELNEFFKTGVMPKHTSTYISKEEYAARKKAEASGHKEESSNIVNPVEQSKGSNASVVDDDDPFMDAHIKPRS